MKINTAFYRPVVLGLAASLVLGVSVTASAESWDEHKAKRDYETAVYAMNKGYAELGKVVNKLAEDKESSAIRHFNDAMIDFDMAVEYYAKAELPAADKDAIEALKKGLEALQVATDAMEKGDMAVAQEEYDAAQNYFSAASSLMD